jgi:hypothetical protein
LSALRRPETKPFAKAQKAAADPAAREALALAIRTRRNEVLDWNLAHPHMVTDPAIYEPIRIGLASVALGQIVAGMGLSKSHVQAVRSGKKVPHARHWAALADLWGLTCPKAGHGLNPTDLNPATLPKGEDSLDSETVTSPCSGRALDSR